MATGKRTLGCKASEDIHDAVEEYRKRHGLDTKSDAVKDLLQTGMRESRSPIMARVKDRAIESAYYLTLVAIVTTVVGAVTTLLTFGTGLMVALVLVAIAALLVAVAELGRALGGHGDLVAMFSRGEHR